MFSQRGLIFDKALPRGMSNLGDNKNLGKSFDWREYEQKCLDSIILLTNIFFNNLNTSSLVGYTGLTENVTNVLER